MSRLADKQICLVVTGGIAAYKAPDIVRQLKAAGARVQVVMTAAAQAFVQALTFQAVSGQPVHIDLLDSNAEAAMGHIELARWADLVLVAPASADFMARVAHGLADDLATTLCLASAAPLLLAPAMNQQMWRSAATAANLELLAARGVHFCGPDSGAQACGDVGPGRMSEPAAICAAAEGLFGSDELSGVQVLITAGPTQEAIDPVRFITNRSSGKMGFAVAAAALAAGARVTLVAGPSTIAPPRGCEVINVRSAAEMHNAVLSRSASCDIFIGTAAVADYTVATPATAKIKKSGAAMSINLVPTTDILAAVSASAERPFTVGFAAETERLEDYARTKLQSKQLDMIAANLVGMPGSGFESDDNELSVYWADGGRELGKAPKSLLARWLIELIAERYHGQAV
jgi:phosphopantothenoylcysteine decarboxylase/phosphopantothenate--cysteine ligase